MIIRLHAVGWILLSACLLQGCGGDQSVDEDDETGQQTTRSEELVADAWYHPEPESSETSWITNSKEVADADVYEVVDAAEARAEALLQREASVPLSPVQATEFAKRLYNAGAGKSAYLVRSVYLNKDTGGFELSQQGSKLRVFHSSLGHGAASMKRKALIVQLTSAPTEVFVSCGMAE